MDFNLLFSNKKRKLITNKNYEKTLFLNLFTDWLSEAERMILLTEGFINEKSIKLSFNSLYDIIIEVSERTLFVEYNVFVENKKKSKKFNKEILREFEERLLSVKYRKYLLHEYPELFRLVFRSINNFVDNIKDIVSHYIKDFTEIKKTFNLENSEIEYIRMGLGDSHNKNKSTTLLKISGEKFIIFKPRDLAIELCFSNFLTYYNNSCKTNIYLPETLYRKNYSWTEFIEHSNDVNSNSNLYEEIGHILCILYFLNGTDFHYENIIINNKKGLVLIDCESLLYPLLDAQFNEHTVLSIGLLSKKIKIGDELLDFGGINLNENQAQEFPISKESITIENGEFKLFNEKNKLVKPNNFQFNEQDNINDYIEEILVGFESSYRFLMKNKKKIIPFFDKDFSSVPVRFLLRNTFLYAHVLYESLSPILLTDENERIAFIEQMEEPYNEKINLLDSEVADIYNNDIPYYYCNIRSTVLENHNGLKEKKFFKKSPLDSLLYKLNKIISKEDLQQQLLLIKYNFAQNAESKSSKIFTKKNVSENINLTYDFFRNLVRKNITYLTLQESYDSPNQYNLEYSNNDIINGKFGDLLFLAEANKKFNNNCIKKIISRIYDQNINHIYNSDYLGMAGIGGTIYFLLRMYKIYNDNKYINDAITYIDSLDLLNIIENSKNNGIIYGRAGLLIALIELEKLINSLAINKLVHYTYNQLVSSGVKCPEGIYWTSEFHNKPLCGVAHGSSGIILSLLRYFKQFKNLECKNIIKQSVMFENTFYSDKNKNWKDNRSFVSKEQEFSSFGWSHGSPGIGLVRLELVESDIFISEEFLNILKRDLKNCVESTLENGLKGKDSLIYGKYGSAELLVRFSKHTNNFELLAEIEGYLNSFNNLYFIKNNKGLIIPGLFNGVSGYGYQLLFFNNYIKNSILTFDCN